MSGNANQLDLQAWYHVCIAAEEGGSIFDLQAVAIYLLPRYAREGRAWFGAGMSVHGRLNKKERELFLEFLRRNQLSYMLDHKESSDDGRRKKGKNDALTTQNETQPGRRSLSQVAGIDWSRTPLFGDPDQGPPVGKKRGRKRSRPAPPAECPQPAEGDAADGDGVKP
jgi:hypothetical protein